MRNKNIFAAIMSLWFPEATYQPAPVPTIKVLASGTEHKPQVLMIGTSFSWALLRILDAKNIFHKRNFLYYFKREFTFPVKRERAIDKETFDWSILNKIDTVIIEVNESRAHKAGYGFIKEALKRLK